MQTGMVKWFNNAKGWGFISDFRDGTDIFVHYSQIRGDGYRTLRQGQEVEFVLRDGPRGKWAEEVVGAACEVVPPVGTFEPALQWHWTGDPDVVYALQSTGEVRPNAVARAAPGEVTCAASRAST